MYTYTHYNCNNCVIHIAKPYSWFLFFIKNEIFPRVHHLRAPVESCDTQPIWTRTEQLRCRLCRGVLTYLSLLNTSVERLHLTRAQTVHKVVLLPTGHQDWHLCDTSGLCGEKGSLVMASTLIIQQCLCIYMHSTSLLDRMMLTSCHVYQTWPPPCAMSPITMTGVNFWKRSSNVFSASRSQNKKSKEKGCF